MSSFDAVKLPYPFLASILIDLFYQYQGHPLVIVNFIIALQTYYVIVAVTFDPFGTLKTKKLEFISGRHGRPLLKTLCYIQINFKV